jgi:hypothetical protein
LAARQVFMPTNFIESVRALAPSPVRPNRVQSVSGVPLGALAPSPVRPNRVESVSGVPLGKDTSNVANAAASRDRRYTLQAVARRVLPDNSRLNGCLRTRIPSRAGVSVYAHPQHQSASYGDLMRCGSVWCCPVCAAKVSEKRRIELEAGVAAHRANGGLVLLVSFTVAHGIGDDLSLLLQRFTAAERSMKQSGGYGRLKGRVGLVGTVRALEVTYGRMHGFHPHAHALYFVAADTDVTAFTAELFRLWQGAAERQGLTMNGRGLDVRATVGAVGSYVAKWGAAAELTNAGAKRGRAGGLTPWELLAHFAATGEVWARDRFRDYAGVFKGRHQLTYSHGLKSALGLAIEADKTDAELAVEAEHGAVWVGELSPQVWALVVRHEARAMVLNAVVAGGWEEVEAVLIRLWSVEARGRPPAA